MSDRPILFSAPMVRALLAGTKTQTRRVLKPQPGPCGVYADIRSAKRALRVVKGDRLWVRETWAVGGIYDGIPPRDINPEGKPGWCGIRYAATDERFGIKDRVSIHMPRWASRLTLTVTDVRVQRLQAISEEDAEAEGCALDYADGFQVWYVPGAGARHAPTAVGCYANLWDSINGAGAWDANPWIVAYTFTVENCNIDALSSLDGGR